MSTGWILLPEGTGWLRPHLDALADLYCRLRAAQDAIPAFEQTFADSLDEKDYERIQSFFDGEHDAVYGPDAGDHARAALRNALEAVFNPGGVAPATQPAVESPDPAGELVDVERFYDEDPRRRSSREIEFGNFWSLGKLESRWFVSWIEDTGELIAVGPALDASHRRDEDGRGQLTYIAFGQGAYWLRVVADVLCVEPDLTRLESRLAGWEDQRGRRDSYRWLKERVGAA